MTAEEEKKKRITIIRRPCRYMISLTEAQDAILQSLMASEGQNSVSVYVGSMLYHLKRYREQEENKRGALGRPKKQADPADDPNAPGTLRNPLVDDPTHEAYFVNAFMMENSVKPRMKELAAQEASMKAWREKREKDGLSI